MLKKTTSILIFFFLFCYSKNNDSNPIDLQIEKLVKAIHTRDTAYIYQHVFDDVQTGFDADGMGIASFRDRWNLSTTSEKDWKELQRIVEAGGKLIFEENDSSYIFPYLFPLCQESDADYIVYDKTPILKNPQGDTILISKPQECKRIKTDGKWVYIELNNKMGYVYSDNIYGCYDFRMALKKDKNDWKIKWLVAGD